MTYPEIKKQICSGFWMASGAALAMSLILVGCGGTSEPTDAATLAACYSTEFGSPPPPAVTNIRAKQVIVGDAGAAWIRFEANSNVVMQIVSNRFMPSDQQTFTVNSGGGNMPAWWKPDQDSLTVYLINNQ